MFGRLFKSFEKRVKCFFGEHMNLVNYVNFVRRFKRQSAHRLAKLADVVYPPVGSGVNFIKVVITASDRLGENSGNACLPRPARTSKEIAMRNIAKRD